MSMGEVGCTCNEITLSYPSPHRNKYNEFKPYGVHVTKSLGHTPLPTPNKFGVHGTYLFVMPPSFHRNKCDDFKLYGTHVAKSLCHVHSSPNRNKYHDFKAKSFHVPSPSQ